MSTVQPQQPVIVQAAGADKIWAIVAGILAGFHAVAPILVHIVDPDAAKGIAIADAADQVALPIIIQSGLNNTPQQ